VYCENHRNKKFDDDNECDDDDDECDDDGDKMMITVS